MKSNKYLYAVLFVLFLMKTVVFSQTAHLEASLAHPAEAWKPFKIGSDGSNVKDNVEFYKMVTDCGGKKTIILKVLNKNNFAVRVSYQKNSTSPKQIVEIPALKALDGWCGATGNEAGLVIEKNMQKNSQEDKEYLRSHFEISKL